MSKRTFVSLLGLFLLVGAIGSHHLDPKPSAVASEVQPNGINRLRLVTH
jgi:hypothetical protein